MDAIHVLPPHEDGSMSPARHKGGRRTLSECYRDMSKWPGFDDATLKGAQKKRYCQLRDATALYLAYRPMREVLEVANVTERRFLRIFARCLRRDSSGEILGCRAFVKNSFASSPVRITPLKASVDGKGGFFGMFRKLLRDHPKIAEKLVTLLNGYGLKGLRPNRLMFRGVHLSFCKFCEAEGLGIHEYPLNTGERARRALRAWIDSDYLPKFATRFVTLEHGIDAGGLAAYGEGDGQADRLATGYGAWIIDANTIDLYARYEVPNAQGDWEQLELRRFQELRLIHKGTSANLANRQVYSPQVSAEDVAMLLWDGVAGPSPVREVIQGLREEEGAGYPANVIPELRFAIPAVVYLDNALAHLADHVQHIVSHLFGANVILGRPKTPHERAAIESKFSLQARRILHQLPSTAGSGPKDPRRKGSSVPIEGRVRAEELEHVLDVYVMNENAVVAAGAHNVAPLVRLRRQLVSGALKPQYLPMDKRKAHYFNRPIRVTVKVDPSTGRRPYINYLYQRYSSNALCRRFDLKERTMYVRPDFRNLRTVMLFTEDGCEFGPVQALGHWGTFPHDVRIRRLFGRLKRDGELDARAEDRPLEALFTHLRNKAPRNTTAALQLANLCEYLKRNDFQMGPMLEDASREWAAASEAIDAITLLPMAQLSAEANDVQPNAGPSLPASIPSARTFKVDTVEINAPVMPERWVLPRRKLRQ
ncbi:hypothetical protein [Rhodoferax ferrireducens]|uniref:hypothetical protein n=1 Tax=Rhodoferax ferrireducens TaxID=192843 RepID=UPI00130033D8|nr:hypothetical protein [Rhodoferax ferrireducens]